MGIEQRGKIKGQSAMPKSSGQGTKMGEQPSGHDFGYYFGQDEA
jgi:hypothetical protein